MMRKWIRSVGAKRRAAKKWSNWGMQPPPSIRDYAVGVRYFRALPEPPAVRARVPVFNHHGEGSSLSAAPFFYAQTDAEDDGDSGAFNE